MEKNKRKISVGFIEPKPYDFEDNVIYVTLTPHAGVFAEAASREYFIYNKKETKRADNVEGHSRHDGAPIYASHWDLIRMLKEENNGEIDKYRMETDGLKLAKLVQETHYKTELVKTF